MLHWRGFRTWLVAGASVLASAVLATPACGAHARATAHTHRGAYWRGSDAAGCVCIPTSPWGYYPRQWRPWPGDGYRQDIVFPQTIGIERLGTPRGEKPRPLPREKYGKRKTKAQRDAERASRLRILDGGRFEKIERPIPFEYAPGPERGLNGLDGLPPGSSSGSTR